jgi:hypothetical protein
MAILEFLPTAECKDLSQRLMKALSIRVAQIGLSGAGPRQEM